MSDQASAVDDNFVGKREAIRHMLEKCLFVSASDLPTRISAASKNMEGKFTWITLDRDYHSVLVKTVLAICKSSKVIYQLSLLKEVLFEFLLSVLNGQPQPDFFSRKET